MDSNDSLCSSSVESFFLALTPPSQLYPSPSRRSEYTGLHPPLQHRDCAGSNEKCDLLNSC